MCFIFGASTFNVPPEGLFQIGNVPPSIDFYRRGILFVCTMTLSISFLKRWCLPRRLLFEIIFKDQSYQRSRI